MFPNNNDGTLYPVKNRKRDAGDNANEFELVSVYFAVEIGVATTDCLFVTE